MRELSRRVRDSACPLCTCGQEAGGGLELTQGEGRQGREKTGYVKLVRSLSVTVSEPGPMAPR